MTRGFSERMSELRRKKGASQRTAAAELGISQALLSHYENGAREPGLGFVCRACDYYGVTADYLLCRSDEQGGQSSADVAKRFFDQMRAIVDRAEMALEEFSE